MERVDKNKFRLMKTYRELKKYCDEKIKKYPQYEKMYRKEIVMAKRYYGNNRNLFEELSSKKIKNNYVIPFLLEITNNVKNEDLKTCFVRKELSGAIDIDSDFSSSGKKMIQEYLLQKYGEDRVIHVGTFTKLGPSSAAKDLLRIYKIDYGHSNEFTKVLDKSMTWKQNIENLKENFQEQYKFYEQNKSVLDLVPYFINKTRQSGKHAGGIVITDEPIYKLIPVDKVGGEMCTAFPESNQEQVLDELGVVKFDILAISIMDVIRETVNMVEEKIFLIEEDNVLKVVPESYIDKEIEKF